MKTTINELSQDFISAINEELKETRQSLLDYYKEFRVELSDHRDDKFVGKITCRILTPEYYRFSNYCSQVHITVSNLELKSLLN